MSFWLRLKDKWGIRSNWQMTIIFIVFAITGMSAVEIRKILFPLMGVVGDTPFYVKFLLWLFVIFPFYYVFLLTYGFIFGQFPFFWAMTKKTFGRFGKPFRR
ncbi:DUF6787 family protein [Sporocytophaga myxococcoides]|uniref:DUF6787 family protein n=1 Tax=Sporocytophaga myxococcoides TaxID=153721 RepID=UPI00048AF576|nr:DUF6787 family protein [Sporocytophaga myxococcoides]